MSQKLIAFTGGMGSGKSTAIEALQPYVVGHYNVKFAQPLYDIQEYAYDRIAKTYSRPDTFVKDRLLLQWLGTDWGRETIRQTLWCDLWEAEVASYRDRFPWATFTADDVRFDTEGESVKRVGGIIVKLVRTNTNVLHGGLANHKSEAGINDKYVDYTIENNGSLEEFQSSLRKLYETIVK